MDTAKFSFLYIIIEIPVDNLPTMAFRPIWQIGSYKKSINMIDKKHECKKMKKKTKKQTSPPFNWQALGMILNTYCICQDNMKYIVI